MTQKMAEARREADQNVPIVESLQAEYILQEGHIDQGELQQLW